MAGRENPVKRVRTIIIGPCSKIALFLLSKITDYNQINDICYQITSAMKKYGDIL